jgi:hypothetical protein
MGQSRIWAAFAVCLLVRFTTAGILVPSPTITDLSLVVLLPNSSAVLYTEHLAHGQALTMRMLNSACIKTATLGEVLGLTIWHSLFLVVCDRRFLQDQ